MNSSAFVYVTYIATTPEQLWKALTDETFTVKYWFGRKVRSDWKEGSPVEFVGDDGIASAYGVVLECQPYRRLSYTFQWADDQTARERPTKVTFELQPADMAVKLSLRHEQLLPEDWREDDGGGFASIAKDGVNNGWPFILSNLKSLLETGAPLKSIKA